MVKKTLEEMIAEVTAKYEAREAKANEAKAKKQEEAKAIRSGEVATVQEVLKTLDGLTVQSKKELAPAIKRLQMFVAGEKYTRNGGNN